MTNGPAHRPAVSQTGHGIGQKSQLDPHRTPPPVRPPVDHDEPIKLDDDELESVALVEDDSTGEMEKKIKAFGVTGAQQERKWSRQATQNGTGACRVRSFHGKLSDQGMEYLDNAINDWLDHHPEIEVKFVTSSVGQFDGKIREPALVLNVWY